MSETLEHLKRLEHEIECYKQIIKEMISDLVLRAELRGDDCLDISDGILRRAEIAITKAKGENE
jgi:hypothetical protein